MKESEKIKLLTKLVQEYLTYIDRWDSVEVHHDRFEGLIQVTWYKDITKADGLGKLFKYTQHSRREFSITDLDERIASYRNKIKYAKNKNS